jgi:thiol:disulfide interchange protein
VPTFVFLKTDGTLSKKVVGEMSAQDFEAELAKLK